MPLLRIKLPLIIFVILIAVIGCRGKQGAPKGLPPSDPIENQSAATRSAVIVGSSMGPIFLGDHVSAVCTRCEFPFVAGFLDDPNQKPRSIEDYHSQPLACPNCGHTASDHSMKRRPRDNVMIIAGKKPKRWSVVAFHQDKGEPQSGGVQSAGIKRVVGVSEDRIHFHDGNLYLTPNDAESFGPNDASQLIRKPLAIQQKMAVLIHDTKFSDGSKRWKGSLGDSNRKVFQPRACYLNSSESPSAVIEDSYGCNQNLARSLNETDELLCRFELSSVPVTFSVGFHIRGRKYSTEIDIKRTSCSIYYSEDPEKPKLTSFKSLTPFPRASQSPVVVVSSIDHQLIVAIDGRVIAKQPIVVGPGDVSAHPIWFSVSKTETGESVSVNRIQLYRDIYYFSGPLKAGADGKLLPALLEAKDGYLLIGDNVPLSFDSRHWENPSVSSERIIGVIE